MHIHVLCSEHQRERYMVRTITVVECGMNYDCLNSCILAGLCWTLRRVVQNLSSSNNMTAIVAFDLTSSHIST
jgi:hypothetical protein